MWDVDQDLEINIEQIDRVAISASLPFTATLHFGQTTVVLAGREAFDFLLPILGERLDLGVERRQGGGQDALQGWHVVGSHLVPSRRIAMKRRIPCSESGGRYLVHPLVGQPFEIVIREERRGRWAAEGCEEDAVMADAAIGVLTAQRGSWQVLRDGDHPDPDNPCCCLREMTKRLRRLALDRAADCLAELDQELSRQNADGRDRVVQLHMSRERNCALIMAMPEPVPGPVFFNDRRRVVIGAAEFGATWMPARAIESALRRAGRGDVPPST